MKNSIIVLLCLMLLTSLSALAEVYKRTLPDGTVEFTDRPSSSDDKPVKLEPINTVPAPKRPPIDSTSNNKQQEPTQRYNSLSITSPTNDETVRDNAGNVIVNLSVEPPLARGHQFGVTLDDGKEVLNDSGQIAFTNVDRGTHSINARVVDANGNTLVTATSVFHLMRATAIRPTPRANP